MSLSPFHVAFPVDDLAAARTFYGGTLRCPEGRSSSAWVNFDLYGHQIVAHLVPRAATPAATQRNPVDGHDVPIPHFGVILPIDEWRVLAARLQAVDIPFLIKPHIRFKGQPGEQASMFLLDPAGNALEFKSFEDPSKIFAR